MATQTGTQDEIQVDPNADIMDCRFSQDASAQSVLDMRDAETQSILGSSKNLSTTATQTDIGSQEPKRGVLISKTPKKDKPRDDDENASKSSSSLRKCFFKRPLIVVQGGSILSPDLTMTVFQSEREQSHPSHLVTSHKKDKETQYENPISAKEEILPSGQSSCSKILDKVQELETKLERQERSLKDLQGSLRSWKAQKCKPSDCRALFEGQPKHCELPRKPATSDEASQSKEDDCECRTLSKEFIQIFIKPEANQAKKSNSIECGVSSPSKNPKPIATKCGRNDEGKISQLSFCKTDKKESCMKINRNSVTISPCSEDTDNFLQQFNRVFAKSNSEETVCGKSSKIPESNQKHTTQSSCCSNPSMQNLKNQDVTPCCVKVVEWVTDPNAECLDTRKVSSTSCLETKKCLKQSQSCETVENEVYKTLIEQFINLFTKSKTCENKQAHKEEPEPYSFDRLLAELVKLFAKPKCLEASDVKEEERSKKVTISEKETVFGDEQTQPNCNCSDAQMRNFKSTSTQSDLKISDMSLDLKKRDKKQCESGSTSTVSEIGSSSMSVRNTKSENQCQFCGNGSLPVLDSLSSELFHLIGPRPFDDVVLTILRQRGNVYHINVREMATGKVLGCVLANGTAINEAIALGLFEDIHTFCELDRHREHDPRDCPLGTNLDALCPRERGGEFMPDKDVEKARAIEFSTRVLGVPAGQAGRFFSLTNALKLAKKSPYHSLEAFNHREKTRKRVCIGRGAVTGNLVYMSSDEPSSVTDCNKLGQTSSLFLRIVSGQDNDVQEDE
ncbi:LOW QUALITY PROTEIN: uncharacterized protein LOC108102511 [Drosophila eugracilis]|uniref:LOW QUALITY PROTEIN: uncharacterized protein LOC108102511 n=1 Tax=Drosophila eugracilis TaxID=29029 RepID=UPI001BD9CF12|nr:LOW QUALITY PROTEIN: uncharacterized protein LOC108102511 [Drosophila eugracilis]